MKNLAKILMSLAVVMLISASAFAQDAATGVVTVDVVPGVEFGTGNVYDIAFILDPYGDTTDLEETQVLAISANSPWDLTIDGIPSVNNLTDFGLDHIFIDGVALSTPPTYTGIANPGTLSLVWTFTTGNIDLLTVPAGLYTMANLNYTLSLAVQ